MILFSSFLIFCRSAFCFSVFYFCNPFFIFFTDINWRNIEEKGKKSYQQLEKEQEKHRKAAWEKEENDRKKPKERQETTSTKERIDDSCQRDFTKTYLQHCRNLSTIKPGLEWCGLSKRDLVYDSGSLFIVLQSCSRLMVYERKRKG